jgi:hypothetical protein
MHKVVFVEKGERREHVLGEERGGGRREREREREREIR